MRKEQAYICYTAEGTWFKIPLLVCFWSSVQSPLLIGEESVLPFVAGFGKRFPGNGLQRHPKFVPLRQDSVQNLQLLLRPQLGLRLHPPFVAARPPEHSFFLLQFPSRASHLPLLSLLCHQLPPLRQFLEQHQR